MHGTQKIVKAVNDVDLKIYENEIYGIAGESGCGKTTLLKALYNDIVPPLRLIGGKIYYRINGGKEVDVTTLKPEEKRKLRMEYISYIPQGSMSVLNPVLKIKETYKDFIGSHVRGPEPRRNLRIGPQTDPGTGLTPKYPRCLPPPVIGWNAPARDHRPGGFVETAHHDWR